MGSFEPFRFIGAVKCLRVSGTLEGEGEMR